MLRTETGNVMLYVLVVVEWGFVEDHSCYDGFWLFC